MCLPLVTLLAALAAGAAAPPPKAAPADPLAPMLSSIAAAESELKEGELESAESHYRDALMAGWLLLGTAAGVDGRTREAHDAFLTASSSAVENRLAVQSLVLTEMQLGQAAQAVDRLVRLISRNPGDRGLRMLLAQADVANGQPQQAVLELEEAFAGAPQDLELAFALAGGYLRLGRTEPAEKLFARIAAAHPGAATHVLIGRTYRDFGQYDRARDELLAALAIDPAARRAHYYLGMIHVTEGGVTRLDDAIAEFRQELALVPKDPLSSLQLGMAYVEARRYEEALPLLELAAASPPPQGRAFYYLGRCQLGLERAAQAVASQRRALELATQQGAGAVQLGGIHNQLGLALRASGAAEESAAHFAEASRIAGERAEASREQLARYLASAPDPETGPAAVSLLFHDSPLAALASADREAMVRRARTELARAYLNLGVMQAKAERFDRAAEHLERAVAADADFPQAQRALAIAEFNAQRFDKATAPLERALAEAPDDLELRRMLATALIQTEAYGRAAELLAADPGREDDPQLQFLYGLALVRSGRPADGERVFSRMLALHGESAEVGVMLGQARAQEGDYKAAVETLTRALQQKPDVAEANATLGVIYLRQGKLEEAERALQAELRARPGDVKSANALATVLDLQGRPDEAVPLLRTALKAKPDYADARYLLGRLLLAKGSAAEAVEHLEAAAHVAPEDANIHYQLGRAYQALGRTQDAEREFELFRQVKAKSREAH
ncbi:MAG TPA: tetratricopeptide repeat protein, partial [Vicinamibacteria bacterium]|nr:tetratricopeptide repeat protein [Vicinamibacteria bacterium]